VPADLNDQLLSCFIQDEIVVIPAQVFLSLGVRLEHNHYTGFGTLPSARVAWTVTQLNTLWAAVSKTERTPAEIDAALRATFGEDSRSRGIPALLNSFRQSADRQRRVDQLRTGLPNDGLATIVNRFQHLLQQQQPSTD
jgi:hypothetical protein